MASSYPLTGFTMRSHRGLMRLTVILAIVVMLIPVLLCVGCVNDDDNMDLPDPPADPSRGKILSRTVLTQTTGGKIAVRQVLIWIPELKDWYVTTTSVTFNPARTPEPGLAAGAQAATTSGPHASAAGQGRQFQSLALFTGGIAGRGTFASNTALLYDHEAEEWVALSLLDARVGHTMTTLADGRILIVGGWNGDTAQSDFAHTSAELFDPSTRSFQFTGPLAVGRTGHAAGRLPDGRILVTGGEPNHSGGDGTSAELYDPGTGSFKPTTPMVVARVHHHAVPLVDGRILVVGSNGTRVAEVFDPATETFSPVGETAGFHGYGATATPLLDGRVLIIGGLDNDGVFTDIVETFDPATNTFAALAALPEGRGNHSAVLNPTDGTVLVCGGYTPNGATLDSCLLFDPVTNTFQVTTNMPQVNAEFIGVFVERAE